MIFSNNINSIDSKDRILIAPLDWGLGHATRCIPIIRACISKQKNIYVAAEGRIANLIKTEFPDIIILPLRGYNIRYAKNARYFLWQLLIQLPKIWLSVRREKKWLAEMIKLHQIDCVISDNRLGCQNKKILSIFITHQLGIKTGYRWMDPLVRKINYSFINSFNECWVPDIQANDNFAGELSHPVSLPKISVKYIGLLSRLEKGNFEKKYKIIFLLSGPEPQRTFFEQMIVGQLSQTAALIVIVRGLPDNNLALPNLPPNIKIFNHLPSLQLSQLIQESEMAVARSGYSSIMDFITLEQKAILVPTPGQTEQEYLANYVAGKNNFIAVSQQEFNLNSILSIE